MLFTDELSCVQDELCGIRVKADLYRDLQAEEEFFADYNAWCEAQEDEGFEIPFVVECWHSGWYTETDDAGNVCEYRDGWPEWFVSSYHRTRKGAEIAVCYHQQICPTQDIRISERHWVEGYEKKYITITD